MGPDTVVSLLDTVVSLPDTGVSLPDMDWPMVLPLLLLLWLMLLPLLSPMLPSLMPMLLPSLLPMLLPSLWLMLSLLLLLFPPPVFTRPSMFIMSSTTPLCMEAMLATESLEPSPLPSLVLVPLLSLPSQKKEQNEERTIKELLTCCKNMNNNQHEFASYFKSSHSKDVVIYVFC